VGQVGIKLIATDPALASITTDFSIQIVNVNDAPTGTVGVGGTAIQGQTLAASNTLADIDGLGSIGYQWQFSTDGTTWNAIDGATADSFMLGAAQVGQQVRVTASYIDGHGTAELVDSSATTTIVGVNNAPTLATALADQTATEDVAFAFMVPAGSFADTDLGDVLSYTAIQTDGAALPAWLAFDAATRSFSGTPTSMSAGLWNVRVTATDLAGAVVSDDFVLDVANHIVGTSAANNLVGTALRDVIEGFDGNDTLNGGAGADTLIGGLGNDVYVIDNTGDVAIENAGEGADTVQSSISYTLGTNLENLTLLGTSAINGTGNELNNVIVGNAAANILDGGAGNDSITGGASGDTLIGGDGNDVLNGGLGADTMIGGIGNDTYYVDDANDIITEFAGEGTDLLISTASYVLADGVENLTLRGTAAINGTGNALNNIIVGNVAANVLDGGAGDDSITGGASADTLIGGDGNDLLNGGLGADAMIGGAGNDSYTADDAGDTIIEMAGEGLDIVNSSVSYTLSANIERLTLSGNASIDGIGNDQDNLLTGNAAANVLSGGAGNDTLNGATGADTLIGGLGDDTYILDNVGDVIVEAADEGVDQVNAAVSYTLTDNVDNLTLTGNAALNATGNAQSNVLIGNAAANTLDGGGGTDTLIGGLGNDIYVVDNAADVVIENTAQGTDTVQSSVSYTLGANLENLTLIGPEAIDGTGNELSNALTGNAAANTLSGGAGNDTLNGGAGIDTMSGGLGNDIYVVDDTADITIENAAEGTDTVQSSVSYALGANVENLTLTGTDAINGTGNELSNVLIGNTAANILSGGAGNDTLNGGVGADTLIGGVGNDIYVVDDAADVANENAAEGTDLVQSTVSYTLGANVENLTLLSATTIDGTGNELNNVLTGNAGANTLSGGAGNDTLNGGTGADTLVGGLGNDIYVVDNAGDVAIENAGEGTDTVQSYLTYTLGTDLENLTLLGAAAIDGSGNELNNVLTGNAAANTLTGGVGNDTLNGGAGADELIGGLGNDTYTVDNVGDAISELADEGLDIVNSSVSYTLSANIERLTLSGTASIDGIGNDQDNLLTGNAAANVLSGGAGNDTLTGAAGADTLIGGLGDDTYTVDNVGDVIVEAAGEGVDHVNASVSYTLADNLDNLTLTGSAALNANGNTLHNLLIGNAAVNVLAGGAGDDTLNGGAGADNLSGGDGNDIYVVDNAGDVVTENANEGIDLVRSSTTHTLAAEVENLTLTGTASISGIGNALDNVIAGTSGNNTLTGNAGNDTLDGNAGTDILIGGTGSDTYLLGAGYGSDTIRENDATAGNADLVQVLSGTSADQLWLRHVGNNLEASIMGTTDKLTLENWYLGAAYHVEQFRTADGKLLLDSQVENLVQAMAAFAPPGAGQTTLPPAYQDSLATVIAANWQ
jgi:Ca2+-binding RTX toxin-like protein